MSSVFLAYINDLLRAVGNLTTSIYANGTNLSFRSNDLSQLNKACNEDLSRLRAYLYGGEFPG